MIIASMAVTILQKSTEVSWKFLSHTSSVLCASFCEREMDSPVRRLTGFLDRLCFTKKPKRERERQWMLKTSRALNYLASWKDRVMCERLTKDVQCTHFRFARSTALNIWLCPAGFMCGCVEVVIRTWFPFAFFFDPLRSLGWYVSENFDSIIAWLWSGWHYIQHHI